MKTKILLSSVFAGFSLLVATTQVIAEDKVIEIKITKNDPERVEASMTNLSERAKAWNVDKMSMRGTKKINGKVTEIIWDQLALKDKKVDLSSNFQSKIILTDKMEHGDSFKAKGDYDALTSAVSKLMLGQDSVPAPVKGKIKPQSQGQNTGDTATASSGSNSSKLSTLSSIKPNSSAISSATVAEVSSTVSCAPRVDYQLNKVFLQERSVISGRETQGCKDMSTYFDLQKDYQSCPISTDVSSKKIIYNFQYFWIDAHDGRNVIDSCQEDKAKTQTLKVTTSYDNCSDFINLPSKVAYSQYQQTYKDNDGKDILIQDCTVDTSKSYTITEDFTSCSARHLFDLGYSIAQSKFSYTKDQKQILVQDCQDTEKKYQHTTTADTCTPIVNNSQVTIFNRKYIMLDNIKQYITECSPLSSNVTIKSENCTTTPFTHDFVTGQSFQNKNYFYLDGSNNRVEVSTCIKSEVAFIQQEDTSVCSEENDDVNLQTFLYAKKYITVDGTKKYITDCNKVTTAIPYTEIGYKWSQEFSSASSPLTASGSGDNVYLGSRHGEEITPGTYDDGYTKYTTQVQNFFNILNYSTTGKCSGYSGLSYNGTAVDVASSNMSSVVADNTVDARTATTPCYNYIANYSSPGAIVRRMCSWILTSTAPTFIRGETQNYTYYQRCQNYRCPIYKLVKKPVLQRRDGTKLTNDSRLLETKYTCGNNSLNGVEVTY